MSRRSTLITAVTASVLAILTLTWGLNSAFAQPPFETLGPEGSIQLNAVQGSNLLVNGNMDQLGFYWRPTNHYVAGQWFEWWGDYTAIPEFIDGGHPHHNQCYPVPADGVCHNAGTGVYNNSQGYIRWGAPFDAGIYQPVHGTTPCLLYTFEIYNRNDTANYHPQIAIDPTGWIITKLGNSLPENCPPDGKSRCPDPYVEAFPSTTIWSPEVSYPALVWGPISLTAEALSTTISVWTRTAPDVQSPSLSSYWDYGSVTYTPFPDNLLPEPSSPWPSEYIENVTTAFAGDTLTITWTTATPASTQVLYTVTRTPTTPTIPLSNTTYLPVITNEGGFAARLDPMPLQSHVVTIQRLRVGDIVDFEALSRRVDGNACVTETSGPLQVTVGTGQIVALDSAASQRLRDNYSAP